MNVSIRAIPRQAYWGVQVKVPPANIGSAVPGALAAIYGSIAKAGREPAGPPFLSDVQVVGEDVSFHVGVPCDGLPIATGDVHGGELPACLAAVYLHRGAYEELKDIYADLQAWVQAHGYRATGPMREVYLTGPDDPRGLRTEVVCPIVRVPLTPQEGAKVSA